MILRGAAGRKLPHGRVTEEDVRYLLENDGDGVIRARAEVARVWDYEKRTSEASKRVLEDNASGLRLTPEQEKRWNGKRYLCLVEVGKVTPVEPFTYERTTSMGDWIMMDDIRSLRKELVT
jgi:hypothetical protein